MTNDYNIKPGENERQYIYRVCQSKDAIGNWDSVACLLNRNLGHEYSSSKYRKEYQYYNAMHEAIDYDNNEEYRKLNDARELLKMERTKLQATKLEVDRELRHKARLELLFENMKSAIERLEVPKVDMIPVACNDKRYILAFGDMHFGSRFKSENNTYSIDIARFRMNTLLANVVRFVQQEKLGEITVVNLGDTIQGILRISDVAINQVPVVESVVLAAKEISQFLNILSAYCKVDYRHVSSANHTETRPLGSKAQELSGEDLEKIIIAYIQEALANNPRVSVNDYSGSHIDIDLFDNYSICAIHGHTIKNTATALKDVSYLYNNMYDCLLMGHQHSAKQIIVGERDNHNLEVLVAPAIVGSDPYSDKLMLGGKSAAQIYEFDKQFGHTGTKTFILN